MKAGRNSSVIFSFLSALEGLGAVPLSCLTPPRGAGKYRQLPGPCGYPPLTVSNPTLRHDPAAALRESEHPSALARVYRRIAGWPRPVLVALTFGTLFGVGLIDYATGYEFSMLVFYLLPIGLAAWFVGRGFALAISLLSIGVWIGGDVVAGAKYANKAVQVWNVTVVLGFFLVIVALLRSLRAMLAELESRVQRRTAALTEEMAERDRLEKEVLEISEREQRRIGHDLHDSLGQHLTATALAGQVLADHLAARRLAPETGEAGRIVNLIEQSIELTRSLAHGLSPVSVEADSLPAALAELAETTTAQFYLPCELRCPQALNGIDPAAAMHLYRIAQESISNAIRHGRANRLDIRLAVEAAPDRLTLSIDDDGVGLPSADARRQGGQGLRIMAHRARIIGATLEIFPGAKVGTTVRCTLGLPSVNAVDSSKR